MLEIVYQLQVTGHYEAVSGSGTIRSTVVHRNRINAENRLDKFVATCCDGPLKLLNFDPKDAKGIIVELEVED